MPYIIDPTIQPRVYIHHDVFTDSHRLFVYRDTDRFDGPSRIIEMAVGFEWKDALEGDAWMSGDGIGRANNLIQQIVNKAWEAGYRPIGFSDIKNETAALKEHLADMKTIAFHQLKIKESE